MGCKTAGVVVRCRCAAAAQLMTVAASPGRTWSIIIAERRLPVLAATPATALSYGGARITHLSGLARTASTAALAHAESQGDFRRQPDSELARYGVLGRAMVSLPVKDSHDDRVTNGIWKMKRWKQIWLLVLLVLATAVPTLAQVDKVTADAKGIT
jgi:hypothetical protein